MSYITNHYIQVRRERKPKQGKVEKHHVQQRHSLERQERRNVPVDSTRSTRAQVTTEKVTVSRQEVTQQEQITDRKSPKRQDIGRIVIDETPEEDDVARKYVSPNEYVKEQVIGVKKSDLKPTSTRDTIQQIDKVDGREQVCIWKFTR